MGRTMKKFLPVIAFCLVGFSVSGCVVLAAAGAGYFVADEIIEVDVKMDQLEKVRNKENGAN